MASVVLGIGLGAVGGTIGGPIGAVVGTALGSALGSYIDNKYLLPTLFPPDDIKGPRLGELRLQGADEGFPMNTCLGEATRVGGEVIWMSNLIEKKKEADAGGGSGGGATQTSFSYFVHMAVSVGLDKLKLGGIERIEKIWADGKLIYGDFVDENEVRIRTNNLTMTIEVLTEPLALVTTFGALVDQVGIAVGDSTFHADSLDRSPEVGESFTVAGDNNIYEVLSVSNFGSNEGDISFRPAAQAAWADNTVLTFNATKVIDRQVTLATDDSTFALGAFKSGVDLEVNGWQYAGNNGTFRVIRSTKEGIGLSPGGEIIFAPSQVTYRNLNGALETITNFVTLNHAATKWPKGLLTSVRIYRGTDDQLPDPLIESFQGVGNTPAYRGEYYVVFENLALRDFGRPPNFEFLVVERVGRTVGQAIGAILEGTGKISKDQYDVSQVTDILGGYSWKGPQAASQLLQPLMLAYDLVAQDRDGVLTFMHRADIVEKAIESTDLGAYGSGGTPREPVDITDAQDNAMPSILRVKYSDPSKDYLSGDQPGRRNEFSVESPVVVELPLTLNAAQARAIAERLLWVEHASRSRLSISLPPSSLGIREADLLSFTAYGHPYKMLVSKVDRGVNGLLEVEGTEEDQEALTQPAISDVQMGFPGQNPNTGALDDGFNNEIPPASELDFHILDFAPLRATDVQVPGIYFALALTEPTAGFPGGVVYESTNGGNTYSELQDVPVEVTMGWAKTKLATALPYRWDRGNKVQVYMEEGTLSSVTEEEVLSGRNYALLGKECIGFANAVLIGPRIYELSMLLRGCRNTENRIAEHATGERFIHLNSAGILFEPVTPAAIGQTRKFKAVTSGGIISEFPAVDHKILAGSIRTFAPTRIRGTRDGSNNLTATWVWRSRAITKIFGPEAAPLLEPSEEYLVEFFNATLTALTRRVTVFTNSILYTAAQQTTDGLTPGNPVTFNLFHVSKVSGPGNLITATV